MMALQKWNGGVIIISHDEKFITTVANQVRLIVGCLTTFSDIGIPSSSGSVETAQSSSSREMCKLTRILLSIILKRNPKLWYGNFVAAMFILRVPVYDIMAYRTNTEHYWFMEVHFKPFDSKLKPETEF